MRLIIAGGLKGQIIAAARIAMAKGAAVTHTESLDQTLAVLRAKGADLLMIDVAQPIAAYVAALEAERIRTPIVACGTSTDARAAVAAIQAGAREYVPLPPDPELIAAVLEAVAADQSSLIWKDPAMERVVQLANQIARSEAPVLVTGESGTGKEVIARHLHQKSGRKDKAFVAVNCAAIPDNLLESELFGHEKGAFTGADRAMAGKFEQAKGGTLFLDEVGDMPLDAQTRLLRVLQEGEFTRVGGRDLQTADVRIVAATHQDLRTLINEGRFREDLFYRLNVVPIRLPPLRERLEDVPDLARAFLRKAESEGLPRKSLSREAADILKKQEWSGNVRELENLMRRLCVLCSEDVISGTAVSQELSARPSSVAASTPAQPQRLSNAIETHLRRYFELHGDGLPPDGLYDRILKEMELPLIALSLSATRGNQVRTAELLGINRNTLRKKIRDLDIRVTRGKRMM